jgi:hypothetical protein
VAKPWLCHDGLSPSRPFKHWQKHDESGILLVTDRQKLARKADGHWQNATTFDTEE